MIHKIKAVNLYPFPCLHLLPIEKKNNFFYFVLTCNCMGFGSETLNALEMYSGEKRLNELGYKQELKREMSLLKTFAITFSAMAAFIGTPIYGSSLLYAGPASLLWDGW
ncbi:hypothetical protein NE237_001165 [Protea cynaroides]|uniref:Uncharacterized protein n=1 Tax=Protea cynaroides TaxID=273540 RepID=A0A9Q0KTL9_9MAGN|nr:hypothetical protein NE237_001165 [Protea cynaroides]